MPGDATRSVTLSISLSAAEHQTKSEQRQHQLPDSLSSAGTKELSCCCDVDSGVDANSDSSAIQDIEQQQQPAESACQLDANFCVTKCVRAVRAGGHKNNNNNNKRNKNSNKKYVRVRQINKNARDLSTLCVRVCV